MRSNPAPIHALGEIAIRCRDHAAMVTFYRDVVGLPIMKSFPDSGITFFKIAEGYEGHTTVLALFRYDAIQREFHDKPADPPEAGAGSSLHHLALTVDYHRQDTLCAFLEANDIPYTVQNFEWVGWRGVFIKDPDGNTVEFVAGLPKPD
ncbi:MAG: VOC family protein [Pseudomonadota bacterium]